MFILGGITTYLLMRWQCGELLQEVVAQADLDKQERLQGSQHRLLQKLQERLNGLQLRRQLLKLQAEPGSEADARLRALYCREVQRGKKTNSSNLPRPVPIQREVWQIAIEELTDVIKRLENSASVTMVYGDIIRYTEIHSLPVVQHTLPHNTTEGSPTLPNSAQVLAKGASGQTHPAGNHWRGWRPRLHHEPQQRGHPRRLSSRWAFVMMAHDGPHDTEEHLWGVLPVARALQRLSSYPLIVLTNKTHFQDGTEVASAFRTINTIVTPIREVDMPARLAAHKMTPTWKIAYWKLQIWTLTEYEKLIWLDSDAIIYRSIDWLFERDWMWAQRDDWFCKLNQTGVCSGIMLAFPSVADFNGLLQYAKTKHSLPGGDQQLIAEYFAKTQRPIKLLSDLEASFGQCLGKAPTPYLNPDGTPVWGVWSIPSFVHKSGGWGNTNNNVYNNVCFSINMIRQRYWVGKAVINICQFHPLGSYWRDLFCDAAAQLRLRLADVGSYCNDACWYRGLQPPGVSGAAAAACGPLNATLPSGVYYGQRIGWPQPEMPNFVI
eukprot:CAMPEP_0172750990 /NCGR_PEP_ID=MMETSP1074-20121228/150676_1 /TAXON_ID=2916 /ORGANISM="Ceratium fusus, Strain PA161109" /LENGTH=548 /DNA_ID=CAMNT_0013583219 /DNA_START=1 /DNA_END=1647 /DNA_ORIENTATION=+